MGNAINKPSVIARMQALGTYKQEFEPTIDRYVALQKEYKKLYTSHRDGGYDCEVSTSSGVKKSPTVSALESLRRDILNLEDALGLTPRGLLKLNEKAFEKTKKPKVDGLI